MLQIAIASEKYSLEVILFQFNFRGVKEFETFHLGLHKSIF